MEKERSNAQLSNIMRLSQNRRTLESKNPPEITFVFNKEENRSVSRKRTVSYVRSKDDNPRETNLSFTNKKNTQDEKVMEVNSTENELYKQDIAKSILNEILSNVNNLRKFSSLSISGTDQLSRSSVQISKRFGPSLHVGSLEKEPTKRPGLRIGYRNKERRCDENRNRSLQSIVKELELPIRLSVNKPSTESSPKLESLVFDTYVVGSSAIPAKSREHTSDDADEVSSETSQSMVSSKTETEEKEHQFQSPFKLCWCFGYNAEVPVINLSTGDVSQIVFANSHYAVLYDFHEDTMSFMQGHRNTVSCMSANSTGSLLATADSSPDPGTSRVIVWDRRPCVLEVLENVHPYGCQRIGLSLEGDFLVTVSADETPPCIKVWDWLRDRENATVTENVKELLGKVIKVTMSSYSDREFAVTFERGVVFAHVIRKMALQDGKEERRFETIGECVFETSSHIPYKLGNLTDTTFLNGDEAFSLSSTSKGYVVVWKDWNNSKHKNMYEKHVRLHLDSITVIETVDNMVAVATVSGNVSFYDFGLKILYFYRLQLGPLVSLSFNLTPQQYDVQTCNEHSNCVNLWKNEAKELVSATLSNGLFSARHFVVSTESARIVYFNASSGTPKDLIFTSKETFTALDTFPNSKFLCAGTASGQCILIDTKERKLKVSRKMQVSTNTCQAVSFLKYSPSGYSLACGMYNGDIWLLDPLLLTPVIETALASCNACITEILFSPESDYLIVIDVSFCISVYFLGNMPSLIGQYIAHLKSIVKTLIDPTSPDTRYIRIFTLSVDRSVCEFVIDRENNSLNFIGNQRVEQVDVPVYSVHYPYTSYGTFLGVNNNSKFKLHDCLLPNTANVTRRFRRTLQAPDLGSPIDFMEIFKSNNKFYMLFKTKHHLGIHLLPLDGNPYQALGFRASPTEIICCRIHTNGEYAFTISESCSGISMWKINVQAVEEFCESGGEGLEPFLRILGEEKVKDLREFFELGQFLHQGESPTLVRTLKNTLPICEVPNVLQALGCLLTKQQIEEITNEIVTFDVNNPCYNIEYEDFVRLYFNNRAMNDINVKELRKAFREFYAGVYYTSDFQDALQLVESDPVFDSASFIKKLLVTGEELTLPEIFADFSILTGGHPESPEDEYAVFPIPPTMPKEMSFYTFVTDILGFTVDESVL